MVPYSIITPDYSITSGGIRVMYGLRSWLEVKGQVVYVNTKMPGKDFVAVYPEIMQGNEAEAPTVARYILNKVGTMGHYGVPGPTIFDPSDHIFVFSKLFDTFNSDADHLLFLPILNLHQFKDQKKKRREKCVLVGKGTENNPEITGNLFHLDRTFANDQQALADYLNTCEVMYSYDQVTAMFEIARLCGVRVVILPNGTYSKEEFSKYEPGMNGISWGLDETKELDTPEFRNTYEELWYKCSEGIDKFIEITQS